MNTHVSENFLEVQRTAADMIEQANVSLARALETLDNCLDVLDKQEASEQSLVFENIPPNPDTMKKLSPKYVESFPTQSKVQEGKKEHSENTTKELVLDLLRNKVGNKMGQRTQSNDNPSLPSKANQDTSVCLNFQCVTAKDKTIQDRCRSNSAPNKRKMQSGVRLLSNKTGSFPFSTLAARKLAKTGISSCSRVILSPETHRKGQHVRKGHSNRNFFKRKGCDGRKRLRRASLIDLTQSQKAYTKRKMTPVESRISESNVLSPSIAHTKRTTTVIKNKPCTNQNSRKNPTKLLPSITCRKKMSSLELSSSGITQISRSLTVSPILPSKLLSSRAELLAKTTKLLKSLEQNNSDESEMLSAKTTSINIVSPKTKPDSAFPLLVTEIKSKECEEKRRLPKERKAKHAVVELSSEFSGTQPLRKRPKIDSGSGTPTRKGYLSRHVAAQERRKRIQWEKKTQLLKSQKVKERRRKAAKRLKNSNMRAIKNKSRWDGFKKPKPKLRGRFKGSGSSNGRKPLRNEHQLNFTTSCPLEMEMTKLFPGVGSVKSYIMSEPDDSDSNMSGDDSDHPGDKKIPFWARKGVYSKLVDAQKCVDPDKIFGQYVNQTIDLAQLYKRLPTKKRYFKRNPSGDWSYDKLTSMENAKYKAEKGQTPAHQPAK